MHAPQRLAVRGAFRLITDREQSKSSGTSPKDFRTRQAEVGAPAPENATAPALIPLCDIASARRIAAAECGHSILCPGAYGHKTAHFLISL
jgi:hypothetical protein